MALGWIKGKLWPEKPNASRLFDRYVSSAPSMQNAVDAIQGWHTSFPPDYHLQAGPLATYNDPRILWAVECFGPLNGRHVLELGPLDGGHTSMLDAAGARVDAIEPDRLAFMRCLITKEILGLARSKFWLGDFTKGLEDSPQNYDLIIASGILYHLKDPLHLIDLFAKRTDAIYLWTHVVTEETTPHSDPRRRVFAETVENHSFHGIDVRAYRRASVHPQHDVTFRDGMSDEHLWLHRDDLLAALKVIGFQDVRTAHDEPNHRFGPALSIFARK
jgi:hypothetical protein